MVVQVPQVRVVVETAETPQLLSDVQFPRVQVVEEAFEKIGGIPETVEI